MFPFPQAMLCAISGTPQVVGSGSGVTTAGVPYTITLPAKALPGDVIVLLASDIGQGGALSASGSGWSFTHSGNKTGSFGWKVLTDLSPITVSGVFGFAECIAWTVFHGVTSVASKREVDIGGSASGVTLSGFTKAANSKFVCLAVAADSPLMPTPFPASPTGIFTVQQSLVSVEAAAALATAAAKKYVDGTTITLTGTNYTFTSSWLLELT